MIFDLSKLTVRQREVYKLIREGKADKEIASLLGISTRTAKSHIGTMYRKLGIPKYGSGRRKITANYEDSLKDTKFEFLLAIAALSQHVDRLFTRETQ